MGAGVGASIGIMVVFYLLIFASMIAAWVFAALAVYNDAMSRFDKDATMFALLVGFFGMIPLVVYAVMRSGRQPGKVCFQCNQVSAANMPGCPFCGAPAMYDPNHPAVLSRLARRRRYIIAAIVCGAIMILSFIMLFVAIFGATAALARYM